MAKSFIHLRVHSEYSLLESVARIEQLIQKAKELHMPALAITDIATMSGVIPFYKACLQEGIKPIIGCEVFIRDKENVPLHQVKLYPLLLLAENNEGYHNLLKLLTKSHECAHRGIPCIDKDQLKRFTHGLIALSGGVKGEIARAILANQLKEAREIYFEYLNLFGKENFFFELQDACQQEQQIVNHQFMAWSKERGIGLVATNGIRYLRKEDHEAYLCLSSIRTGSLYKEVEQENWESSSYFKSPEEMTTYFHNVPSAIENTKMIAQRCNVTIPFEERHLPRFVVPDSFTSETYLREMCKRGIAKKYSQGTKEIEDRLEYELSIIHQMGLEDYFLVVSDLVNFAKGNGIAVGPGRGSAAGSLVCYVLGITEVDPLRYNLFFERFLNPDRISMPDIDLDFSDERREEIIQYAKEKYGKDHVAQIVTFGTLAPRAAIRDVGRVMDISYSKVDQVAKLIPSSARSIVEAVQEQPVLKELAQDSEIRSLFTMVQKIEGLPRHVSTHAAGIIISGEPLVDHVPLQQGGAEIPLTQYSMEVLEEIGLLKIDILGLRNLSVIERAKKIIHQTQGEVIHIKEYTDPATYELLSRGDTTGVFQVESSGMRNVLKQVKPSCFEDVVAVLALYRPGPMEQIPRFIRAKHGVEKVLYPHPHLEEILSPTYGVIVYQEQILQIASKIAGFSLSQADTLRRAVSKKKEEDLLRQREAFVQGCIAQGYDEGTGHEVYDLIVRFANYGFNRSHSVAYGVLAYETAYLKANFPIAYMTALLSTVMGNATKLGEYIGEARRMGISLLPPDINRSGYSFIVDENAIRFGLGAIKYVGGHAIRSILVARKEGVFQDMVDLCSRIDLKICNRRALESLIQCGAMDDFPGHRAMKMVLLDEVMEASVLTGKNQMPLFEEKVDFFPDIDITPYSNEKKLEYELELLGVFVSGHPLDGYEKVESAHQISELTTLSNKQKVCVTGMVAEVKVIQTKKGEQMAFCTIEDQTGRAEVVIFPRVYTACRALVRETVPVHIHGEVQRTDGESKLIANQVKELRKESRHRAYIRIYAHHESKLPGLKEVLLSFPGSTPVYLFYEQDRKLLALPVEKYGIVPSEECIGQVNQLLGEDVVVIKETQ